MEILQIRHLFFGGALAALSACSTVMGGSNHMIDDGQTFAIKPSERVTLADRSQLYYVRVVADSRCPPGAQCIRAGDAEIALQWTTSTGTTQDFSLKTPPERPQTHDLGDRRLTLLSLAHGETPQAQFRIERLD